MYAYQTKHETGIYKPGVKWIRVDDNEWWLQQNPTTSSIFAQGKRLGMDILWVLNREPRIGDIAYTGELIINGERMLRYDAVRAINEYIQEKESMITHAA